ncbi:MAG: GNAT family N-acetyltransferase [Proteobacteria bacterium]|nr:GNAT family N-acetyltransferase [Pseudomonadota bacterium]
MELTIQSECAGVDWREVAAILRSVGMGVLTPELHQKAFVASYATVFIYHGVRLVGFGRAIADGVHQAAFYDCAVANDHQGLGIGRKIVEHLLTQVEGCNVILFATPGKEGFYQHLGLSRMKTGMALFLQKEVMRERGFID